MIGAEREVEMEEGCGFSVDLREKDLRLGKDMVESSCTDRNLKKMATRFKKREREIA